MNLTNMGLLLVFIFSDVANTTIQRTQLVESRWRGSEGKPSRDTCLYRLCKAMFTALREMRYDKPTCRPEYESYNNVINSMGVYVEEILAKMEVKPPLSRCVYISQTPSQTSLLYNIPSISKHLRHGPTAAAVVVSVQAQFTMAGGHISRMDRDGNQGYSPCTTPFLVHYL